MSGFEQLMHVYFDGIGPADSVTVTKVAKLRLIKKKRSWKQKLSSWPWRPWEKHEYVWVEEG